MQAFDLKEFRRINNLTQKQVADILNVSKMFISRVERGVSCLSNAKLALLTDENLGYLLPGGYVRGNVDLGLLNPLVAFRKINGISQEEVADYLGIKRSYVSQIETGRTSLSQDKINRLAANDRGWNAENLKNMNNNTNRTTIKIGDRLNHSIKGNNIMNTGSAELEVLKKENEYLKKLLDEKERTIQTLTNILSKQ